jgi:hypothetical protein
MRNNFVYELIAIGCITVAFNFVIYRLLTGNFPEATLPHYNKMILAAFLLGASIHFIFEITGINEKWCRSTYSL